MFTDLDWTECFLLGALLSPTDPVLSSAVVTNPRVPRLVRHSLNLESGLNDGLALPAVLAFAAALAATTTSCGGIRAQDVTLGFASASSARGVEADAARADRQGIPGHAQSLYALGTAFAIYGVAVGCRRRATASSRCSSARSRSGSAPDIVRASRSAPRTSSRSSSSASSSCSARC